ncbi:helix-turn-helix domain-containing protein [Bifidobacterium callitrichidarum]|uniref:HTH cro/C1-type domain-containing protein n=1 Tax=Bifidobacterium callitrichidarum TaxID=2052941 RepID=A0A2U2N4E0_9BIFI|nr:helix-turn-helix transcriptional regulator [Bifidobacterium callitrichidarum]PWG63839.1 hypothetical protein DF196_09985 [Bifidobacterium callitrichidarum]
MVESSNGYSDKEVGSNLTRLREAAGMSMEMLAAKMRDVGYKWTKATVYNIERGERALKYTEANDVLWCLNLNPGYLNEFSMTAPEVELDIAQDNVWKSLLKIFKDIEGLQASIRGLTMSINDPTGPISEEKLDYAHKVLKDVSDQRILLYVKEKLEGQLPSCWRPQKASHGPDYVSLGPNPLESSGD